MDESFCTGSLAFTEQVTDAAVRLLAGAGIGRLSIGVVAAGMGMTRQSLTERLKIEIADARSKSRPAPFLHQIVVGRFGTRFTTWATRELIGTDESDMPRLAVPQTPDQRTAVRIWLALREQARSDWSDGDPDTAEVVARIQRQVHRSTRRALGQWAGRPVSGTTASRLLALADGLQIATADPVAPMSAVMARTILDREVIGLRGASASAA